MTKWDGEPQFSTLNDSNSLALSSSPGSSSTCTRNIWKRTELYGTSMRSGGASFSQTEVMAEAIVLFLSHLPHRTVRQAVYLSLHQHHSHCLACPTDSLRPYPTKLVGLSSYFQWLFHANGLSWLRAIDFPRSVPKFHNSQTSSIWTQCALYIWLSSSCSGPGSQLHCSWELPSPEEVAAIGRFFCNSCPVAQARHWTWPTSTRRCESQHTLWTASDYVKAPPTISKGSTIQGWSNQPLHS